ncbi:hypothetical protein [Phaeobacter sp. B1627]|uniref:hypothetical protein n=1 Tax=Phaeobacter sp. B1627 TaxID=2583809 RepID=UPI00111897CD|nr:hypothetical protein [Phaeobacter sp. B1627]TNJ43983.1 hypothetical protein FGE21_08415 [Phaeobacter sp. B1627]
MTETLQGELSEISLLLEQRLKLSGSLSDSLRRARRHLPYRLRRVAEDLASAEEASCNPRLAVTLDQARLLRKARRLRAYLSELDLADRRKGRVLDIAATTGFALLVVIALLLVVLRWRGFA